MRPVEAEYRKSVSTGARERKSFLPNQDVSEVGSQASEFLKKTGEALQSL